MNKLKQNKNGIISTVKQIKDNVQKNPNSIIENIIKQT